MARLLLVLAALLTLGSHAAEGEEAVAPRNASTSPQLRGGAAAETETKPQVQQPTGGLEGAASKPAEEDGTVGAEWFDWGHGHEGETCCMCSYQVGGPQGTVVLYAAGDYDNGGFWGSHGAFWHCEHECERKCGNPHSDGHKFGCLDEAHLRSLSRQLRRVPGFRIEHERRFGNLC